MTKTEILNTIRNMADHTLEQSLGMELTEIGDNFICGKMPVDRRTIQPLGRLHGGATAAFAETLGSYGGNLLVDFPNEYCVGIELNISHLRSAKNGFVFGKAQPVKTGKMNQVWEIRITDEKDNLISISRLTLMVLKKND